MLLDSQMGDYIKASESLVCFLSSEKGDLARGAGAVEITGHLYLAVAALTDIRHSQPSSRKLYEKRPKAKGFCGRLLSPWPLSPPAAAILTTTSLSSPVAPSKPTFSIFCIGHRGT